MEKQLDFVAVGDITTDAFIELKHATVSEESYTNRIDTFGRMISLTRQMMINDDLGAFTQIPRIIGRMSALKRESTTTMNLV